MATAQSTAAAVADEVTQQAKPAGEPQDDKGADIERIKDILERMPSRRLHWLADTFEDKAVFICGPAKEDTDEQAEPAPTIATPDDQPDAPDLEPAEKIVYDWLRGLNLKAKVAVLIGFGYLNMDHGTDRWMNDVLDGFAKEIATAATDPACGMIAADRAMLGVALELQVQA